MKSQDFEAVIVLSSSPSVARKMHVRERNAARLPIYAPSQAITKHKLLRRPSHGQNTSSRATCLGALFSYSVLRAFDTLRDPNFFELNFTVRTFCRFFLFTDLRYLRSSICWFIGLNLRFIFFVKVPFRQFENYHFRLPSFNLFSLFCLKPDFLNRLSLCRWSISLRSRTNHSRFDLLLVFPHLYRSMSCDFPEVFKIPFHLF